MTTAPVALFTYKRPEHTKATLDALARNDLADQTDLIIYSDAARTAADEAAVAAVRALIRQTTGFRSVRVVERSANLGLARSIITGVSEILQDHETVIVVEDDLLTARHFLAFMNEALRHYAADPRAFSVTGHTFPAKALRIPRDYAYDTYAGVRCSSWSWGTWRDRWARVDWDMTYYPEFCACEDLQARFNRGGGDMTAMLHMQHRGAIDSWAIRFCYAHTANDMHCIYPVRTLVKNIGLDNSGTHSTPEPKFIHPSLDDAWNPRRFCPGDLVDPRITANFRAVFDPPKPTLLRRARSLLGRAYRRGRRVAARVRERFVRSRQKVEVLIINTYEQAGGAARAAQRTFAGTRRHRDGVCYLTLFRESEDPGLYGLRANSVRGALAQILTRLDQAPLRKYKDRGRALFTPARIANPLRIPLSRFDADLVHVHWVARSFVSVEELGRLKAPVVWTLHDTWAFTGGCHYTGSCEGYRQQCGACPQLGSDQQNDLSRDVMRRKARAFAGADITVVAPSRWLAEKAAGSSLFKGRRIEVIPNGLDTEAFKPIPRGVARDYLSVDRSAPVILFGAEWLPDPRKGGDLLCEALACLQERCTLLTFGLGQLPLDGMPHVTVRSLGRLSDPASLAMAYSAADVFVCPSREDNLPNTVAEALACGTPCVAFDVNGLPDMIEHRRTGWLARPFDASDLAEGLRWAMSPADPDALRAAAREKALADYALDVMAERYLRLYGEILAR